MLFIVDQEGFRSNTGKVLICSNLSKFRDLRAILKTFSEFFSVNYHQNEFYYTVIYGKKFSPNTLDSFFLSSELSI